MPVWHCWVQEAGTARWYRGEPMADGAGWLAALAAGIARVRITVQRTRKRARCVGNSSGWTATIAYWWDPEPGRWVPSKFSRTAPTTDARMLPLLARLCLEAAGEAQRQGLL